MISEDEEESPMEICGDLLQIEEYGDTRNDLPEKDQARG